MARIPESYQSAIALMISEMKKSGRYTPKSIHTYEHSSICAWQIMDEVAPGVHPKHIDTADITNYVKYLRDNGYAKMTKEKYIFSIRLICKRCNNNVFDTVMLPMEHDMRVNVDWLTHEQAQKLLNAPKTPYQHMIVVLELMHGLRMVEVNRMKLEDIHDGYFIIHGKGHVGGKTRSMPCHPSFYPAYDSWMKERENIVNQARTKNKNAVDTGSLFVYTRKGQILDYRDLNNTSIRQNILELNEIVGFKFGNHTLRRTFGREMYRAGVSIVTIAKMLGHESTDVTMKYLGVDLDDMSSAISALKL